MMFRVFIVDQIKVGINSKENLPSYESKGGRRTKNRRIYERFDIDHQHIALHNEEDILLVRDISENGFSCEVPERTFTRMQTLDQYRCKIRYLQEIYETKVEVRWKEKANSGFFIGFKLLAAAPKTKQFFARLLLPLSIACSLQKVVIRSQSKEQTPQEWWQGIEQSNLFLWYGNADKNTLDAWSFEWHDIFVSWDKTTKLQCGTVKDESFDFTATKAWQREKKATAKPDPKLLQFACDVFMACNLEQKNQLIRCLNEA